MVVVLNLILIFFFVLFLSFSSCTNRICFNPYLCPILIITLPSINTTQKHKHTKSSKIGNKKKYVMKKLTRAHASSILQTKTKQKFRNHLHNRIWKSRQRLKRLQPMKQYYFVIGTLSDSFRTTETKRVHQIYKNQM